MEVNNYIDGWSTGKNVYLNDVALEVASGWAFNSTSSIVYMNNDASILRVTGSVAALEARILGGTLIDNTGKGLQVIDLGSFREISVIPEPATGLLVLGGMAMLCVGCRRRK